MRCNMHTVTGVNCHVTWPLHQIIRSSICSGNFIPHRVLGTGVTRHINTKMTVHIGRETGAIPTARSVTAPNVGNAGELAGIVNNSLSITRSSRSWRGCRCGRRCPCGCGRRSRGGAAVAGQLQLRQLAEP